MTIYIHGNIDLPSLEGDIGYNLGIVDTKVLFPGIPTKVRTGAYIALPTGIGGLLKLRSGFASNNAVILNGGVIDAGYTGEIVLVLLNVSTMSIVVEPGMKIAQLVAVDVPVGPARKVDTKMFDEIKSARNDMRGTNGFGSTGIS